MTVDGLAMSSLGKATLHLHIANFKFSTTFIICDKLLDTDNFYSLSYSLDVDKQLFILRKGSFLTYTRNIAVVK